MSDTRDSVSFTYGEWGEVTIFFDDDGSIEVVDECGRLLYGSYDDALAGPDAELVREALRHLTPRQAFERARDIATKHLMVDGAWVDGDRAAGLGDEREAFLAYGRAWCAHVAETDVQVAKVATLDTGDVLEWMFS